MAQYLLYFPITTIKCQPHRIISHMLSLILLSITSSHTTDLTNISGTEMKPLALSDQMIPSLGGDMISGFNSRTDKPLEETHRLEALENISGTKLDKLNQPMEESQRDMRLNRKKMLLLSLFEKLKFTCRAHLHLDQLTLHSQELHDHLHTKLTDHCMNKRNFSEDKCMEQIDKELQRLTMLIKNSEQNQEDPSSQLISKKEFFPRYCALDRKERLDYLSYLDSKDELLTSPKEMDKICLIYHKLC